MPNEYDQDGNLNFSLETVMANAGRGPCRYWIPFSNAMRGAHQQVPDGIPNNPDFNEALDNRPLYDYMVTGLGGEGDTSLLVLEGVLTGQFPGSQVDFAAGLAEALGELRQRRSSGWTERRLDVSCVAGPEIKNCERGRTGCSASCRLASP